jgi:MFS family permease
MSTAAAPAASRPVSGVDANAVLALIAVAQFMVILDATIVNVALPTIKVEVGFSEQSLSWVLNAYTLNRAPTNASPWPGLSPRGSGPG